MYNPLRSSLPRTAPLGGSSKCSKCSTSIGIHTYGVEAPLAGLLGPRGWQGVGRRWLGGFGAEMSNPKTSSLLSLYRPPHIGLPPLKPILESIPAQLGSIPNYACSKVCDPIGSRMFSHDSSMPTRSIVGSSLQQNIPTPKHA